MQVMVCIMHSCGLAATTIDMELPWKFETCSGFYQNKIQESASRRFCYTNYHDARSIKYQIFSGYLR